QDDYSIDLPSNSAASSNLLPAGEGLIGKKLCKDAINQTKEKRWTYSLRVRFQTTSIARQAAGVGRTDAVKSRMSYEPQPSPLEDECRPTADGYDRQLFSETCRRGGFHRRADQLCDRVPMLFCLTKGLGTDADGH